MSRLYQPNTCICTGDEYLGIPYIERPCDIHSARFTSKLVLNVHKPGLHALG